VNETLWTGRLVLRRPTPADVDTIYRIHRDRAACVHNPADLLSDRDEAEALYRRWDEHWQRHRFGYWVVHRDGEPIGFCGVKVVAFRGREVLNLLYRLDPATWGDGVATEAAAAVVGWAAAHAPDRPLIARVRPANVASHAVARRVGLHRAEQLDAEGEDGLDHLYVSRWPGIDWAPGAVLLE
jgi:RimJ/RimL family protein N-acetyltransferase